MLLEAGAEVEGKITGITNFGAFIELPEKQAGLVHISQISDSYVTNINELLKVGDMVKVKVLGLAKNNKYDLSIKQVGKSFVPRQRTHVQKDRPQPGTFEDKITQFLKQSEERLLDLKRNTEEKQGVRKKKKKLKQ